jgi:hypothetical protein
MSFFNKLRLALSTVALSLIATTPYWSQDRDGAEEALKEAGYKSITVGNGYFDHGWKRFNGYAFVTKFNAEAADGKEVTGYVNTGFFSDKTVIQIDLPKP